ncbi:MAG: hypothetical protein IKI15_08300 [Lachnospiraceae bacterium]|nr:hypothetical protein [Lachnospiraceae bacterium]
MIKKKLRVSPGSWLPILASIFALATAAAFAVFLRVTMEQARFVPRIMNPQADIDGKTVDTLAFVGWCLMFGGLVLMVIFLWFAAKKTLGLMAIPALLYVVGAVLSDWKDINSATGFSAERWVVLGSIIIVSWLFLMVVTNTIRAKEPLIILAFLAAAGVAVLTFLQREPFVITDSCFTAKNCLDLSKLIQVAGYFVTILFFALSLDNSYQAEVSGAGNADKKASGKGNADDKLAGKKSGGTEPKSDGKTVNWALLRSTEEGAKKDEAPEEIAETEPAVEEAVAEVFDGTESVDEANRRIAEMTANGPTFEEEMNLVGEIGERKDEPAKETEFAAKKQRRDVPVPPTPVSGEPAVEVIRYEAPEEENSGEEKTLAQLLAERGLLNRTEDPIEQADARKAKIADGTAYDSFFNRPVETPAQKPADGPVAEVFGSGFDINNEEESSDLTAGAPDLTAAAEEVAEEIAGAAEEVSGTADAAEEVPGIADATEAVTETAETAAEAAAATADGAGKAAETVAGAAAAAAAGAAATAFSKAGRKTVYDELEEQESAAEDTADESATAFAAKGKGGKANRTREAAEKVGAEDPVLTVPVTPVSGSLLQKVLKEEIITDRDQKLMYRRKVSVFAVIGMCLSVAALVVGVLTTFDIVKIDFFKDENTCLMMLGLGLVMFLVFGTRLTYKDYYTKTIVSERKVVHEESNWEEYVANRLEEDEKNIAALAQNYMRMTEMYGRLLETTAELTSNIKALSARQQAGIAAAENAPEEFSAVTEPTEDVFSPVEDATRNIEEAPETAEEFIAAETPFSETIEQAETIQPIAVPTLDSIVPAAEEPIAEAVAEEPIAEFAEAAEEPVEKVADAVTEAAEEAFAPVEEISEAVEDVTGEAAEAAEAAEATITETIEQEAETIQAIAVPTVESIAQEAEAVEAAAEEPVAEAVEAVEETAAEAIEAAEETVADAVGEVSEGAEEVAETLTETADEAVEAAKTAVEEAVEAVAEAPKAEEVAEETKKDGASANAGILAALFSGRNKKPATEQAEETKAPAAAEPAPEKPKQEETAEEPKQTGSYNDFLISTLFGRKKDKPAEEVKAAVEEAAETVTEAAEEIPEVAEAVTEAVEEIPAAAEEAVTEAVEEIPVAVEEAVAETEAAAEEITETAAEEAVTEAAETVAEYTDDIPVTAEETSAAYNNLFADEEINEAAEEGRNEVAEAIESIAEASQDAVPEYIASPQGTTTESVKAVTDSIQTPTWRVPSPMFGAFGYGATLAEEEAPEDTEDTMKLQFSSNTIEEPMFNNEQMQDTFEPETTVSEANVEETAVEEPIVSETPADIFTAAEPIAEEPIPEETPADIFAAAEPIAEEPIPKETPADIFTAVEPMAEEPVLDETPVEEFAAEKPSFEEPAFEEPAFEEPAFEEPSFEEPVLEETPVEDFATAEPEAEPAPVEQPAKTVESVPEWKPAGEQKKAPFYRPSIYGEDSIEDAVNNEEMPKVSVPLQRETAASAPKEDDGIIEGFVMPTFRGFTYSDDVEQEPTDDDAEEQMYNGSYKMKSFLARKTSQNEQMNQYLYESDDDDDFSIGADAPASAGLYHGAEIPEAVMTDDEDMFTEPELPTTEMDFAEPELPEAEADFAEPGLPGNESGWDEEPVMPTWKPSMAWDRGADEISEPVTTADATAGETNPYAGAAAPAGADTTPVEQPAPTQNTPVRPPMFGRGSVASRFNLDDDPFADDPFLDDPLGDHSAAGNGQGAAPETEEDARAKVENRRKMLQEKLEQIRKKNQSTQLDDLSDLDDEGVFFNNKK